MKFRHFSISGGTVAAKLAMSLLVGTAAAGLSPAAHASDAAASLSAKSDLFVRQAVHNSAPSAMANVVVQLNGPLTAGELARIGSLGGDVYRHLDIIHAVALRIPVRNLAALAALPGVRRLSLDGGVKKCDEFTVGSSEADVAYQQYNLTGNSVGVAVVDSGVQSTLDFMSTLTGPRLIKGCNFVPGANGQVNSNDLNDQCGHGTHVSGIVAGNGAASAGPLFYRTFYGIARKANIINVRVLDSTGTGTVSQVISGIQWVIANRKQNNIRVMNLSIGHPVGESYTTDPLCQAVEQAWKAGIVVVCAAGNAGRVNAAMPTPPCPDNEGYGTAYGSIQSPANDPYVITVGAMKATDFAVNSTGVITHNRNNDRIATYSSRGPSRLDLVLKPDIVAPGNQVISVEAYNGYLSTYAGNTNDIPFADYARVSNSTYTSFNYFRLSGTSMAAPVIAGAAAMMLEKDSTLTPDTIKARLMISADKWTDPSGNGDPCTYGAGYINIPAALACKAVPTQAALSPSLSIDNAGNVYINMDQAIWGTDINGNAAIWGVYSVNTLQVIWGTNAIWGTSANILDASHAIWGTSVWNDHAIWGTATSAADLSSTVIDGE
jgi:serine protease AprX